MGPRPVIFISAVSQELKSARDLVARTLIHLDYEAKWQDIAPSETGDLRSVLRKWVDGSAGVIQLVGHRYGFEPPTPDAQFGRCSYTQYEALYARQQGKPVWYLLLTPEHPTENPADEAAELADLQRLYRQSFGKTTHLYHPSHSLDRTENIILKFPKDVAGLRAEWERWLRSVEQGIHQTNETLTRLEHTLTDPVILRAKLEEKIDETFEQKRQELLTAKALPPEIDALYHRRDRAKAQVAEAILFITARAADARSPIITRAAAILEERGVDATLDFLGATLKAERQRRKEEGRQLAEASLMKADLHWSRLETAEVEIAIRDAIADAPDWWRPHSALGFLLHERAQWQAAEHEYEAARQVMPAEAEAIILNNLAQLYKATNRLAEAELLMQRVLKIAEGTFGPEHPSITTPLNNLAQLYQHTNRLAEAEPLMMRALKINEHYFGPEHFTVGTPLSNLGLLYKATNRLAEAEPLLERALKIAERSLEPENSEIATRLNNLANVYMATKRFAEAEPLLERALRIDEKCLGQEHPTVAIRLNSLATLYQATKRFAEAEPLMKRALKIDEKSLGPEHPKVAIRLNNLAQLYQATNRRTKVESLMKRALAIDEKSLGPAHPEVAIDLSNLATFYSDTKRLAKAKPLMRRSLVILMKSSKEAGHLHPHFGVVVVNYANLLAKMADPGVDSREGLVEAGREAGFTPEEFAGLLKQLAQ